MKNRTNRIGAWGAIMHGSFACLALLGLSLPAAASSDDPLDLSGVLNDANRKISDYNKGLKELYDAGEEDPEAFKIVSAELNDYMKIKDDEMAVFRLAAQGNMFAVAEVAIQKANKSDENSRRAGGYIFKNLIELCQVNKVYRAALKVHLKVFHNMDIEDYERILGLK